ALRVGLLLQKFDSLAVEVDTGPVAGQVPQQGHVIEAADQVRMGGLKVRATQLQSLIAQGRRGYRITKSDVDCADLVQQSGADQRLVLELGSVQPLDSAGQEVASAKPFLALLEPDARRDEDEAVARLEQADQEIRDLGGGRGLAVGPPGL